MATERQPPTPATAAEPRASIWRGFFRSRLLWLAMVICVVGGGLTVWSWMTRKSDQPVRTTGAAAMGLAPTSVTATSAPEPRFVDRAAPATARLGASFVAAYAVGWLLRRMLRLAAVVTVIALGLVYGLKRLGVLTDPAPVEQALHDAGDWAQREGAAFKDFVLGYIPSAAAGAAGLFVGFIWR